MFGTYKMKCLESYRANTALFFVLFFFLEGRKRKTDFRKEARACAVQQLLRHRLRKQKQQQELKLHCFRIFITLNWILLSSSVK